MNFLIFLHFTIATAIIVLVLIQRSAESSILVSSTHFAPGGANKLLVKITRVLVFAFLINCLLISYIKYGKHNNTNKISKGVKTEESAVPIG